MASAGRKRPASATALGFVGAKTARPVEIPAADHWLHHLIHIAEDVFNKEDLAVVFTALKPTCRLFYEDIKAIQERLAEEFLIAVHAIPQATAKSARGTWKWLKYYKESDYDVLFDDMLHDNLMDVCERAFSRVDQLIELVLVHMDGLFRQPCFLPEDFRLKKDISAYRCFSAAQALAALAA